MNNKSHIIVVGRQFGSGGRKVGKRLAERLNVPYYDKELLSEVARRIGYDEEIFRQSDERPNLFHSLLGLGCGSADTQYTSSAMSREALYRAQSSVIKELANEGSCVIVGRTADYVLRDNPALLSIFLHAPIEWRARNLVDRQECDNIDDAIRLAHKQDIQREKYYNFFTGRHWGKCDNYHLSINPSLLGIEGTVEMILSILEKR